MSQPITPLSSQLQEFDTVSAFPTLITTLTRNMNTGGKDPVLRALDCLPKNHLSNVKRKLERAIHEETLTMDEKTRTKFLKSVSSSESESKLGIAFHVSCTAVDGALKHSYPDCDCLYYRPIFSNEQEAAQALMEWIKKNKFHLVKHNNSFYFKMNIEKEKDEKVERSENLERNEKQVDLTLKTCLAIVRKQTSIYCYDVSNHVYDISFAPVSAIPSIDLACREKNDDD